MAFAYDGAWAQYIRALASGLTRVPDNVPLEQAAILADAVSTPFGEVRTGEAGLARPVGPFALHQPRDPARSDQRRHRDA